jgi:predicted nucleic acid-binding protein
MARAFFDTNILVYAFTTEAKASIAGSLLLQGGDVSVQVLNEFANVAHRKLGLDWTAVSNALADVRLLIRTVHAIDLDAHLRALSLVQRYPLSFYDAMIVASAFNARCDLLYSEDMQDGLEIDKTLVIRNPFTA